MEVNAMSSRRLTASLALLLLSSFAASAAADGDNSRLGIHVIYLEPNGEDAKDYSKSAWGGNIEVVLAPPQVYDALAFSLGFELAQLDAQTVRFIDRTTLLTVEQQTTQDYFRIYLGGRVGHQGHGFLRPYAGANIALNIFRIDTDVVIPDDSVRENEIRQDLESNTETAFGFDAIAGIELNFYDKWYIDVGGKFIKTFSVPQQLGEDAVEIHPQYFQIYVGGGVTFGLLAGIEGE
jgi:opacity protein-like surface antigen